MKIIIDDRSNECNENNIQVCIGCQSSGKSYYQNKIEQAYQKGKQAGFREKKALVKYLEDKRTNMVISNEDEYEHARDVGMYCGYLDVLEIVKSGKYE